MQAGSTPPLISLLRTTQGVLSLARPANMLIAVCGTFAAASIAGASGARWLSVAFAALGAALIGSAGNMINDVFDVPIDRINKPHRALAAGRITRRSALIATVTTAAGGLLACAAAGAVPLLLGLGSSILLYLYSARFKRLPLLGNLTVGLITGAVFILGAVTGGNAAAGVIPALFACFFNVGREILKDVEDMHGDRDGGMRTFPLIHGVEASLSLAAFIFGCIILCSPLPWLLGTYNIHYLVIVVLAVDASVIACLAHAFRDPSTRTLARVNTILKLSMVAGIIALVTGAM